MNAFIHMQIVPYLPLIKMSVKSVTSGCKNGSIEHGLLLGSSDEGTNPTTYTSSEEKRSFLDIFAIWTSIAPVRNKSQILCGPICATLYQQCIYNMYIVEKKNNLDEQLFIYIANFSPSIGK